MAEQEASYADVAAQLRILILLDITGSMGHEIDGVKKATAKLVRLSGEEFSDITLSFTIITFTESASGRSDAAKSTHSRSEADGSGCYVTLAEFTSLTEAQRYINRLELSTPPDQPHVDANGEDEEENQKAAIYKMVELDPAVPTIAFLITDAPPHGCGDRGRTAQHERKWLQDRGLDPAVAADIFQVFTKVLEHFNGNLVFNSVILNNRAAPEIYGNLSQRTGGMLMQPTTRYSDILARGLADVVRALLAKMQGGDMELQELEGFTLMDVSGLNADRQTEQDAAGEVRGGDSKAIFEIAMTRMVAVAGSKFTKRAIGMTAPAEQLQFVWQAARYIYKASNQAATADPAELQADLTSLLKLRDVIVEQLPEEQKGHFTVGQADIERLAEEARAAVIAAGASGVSGATSVISLETVGDALAEDADWDDWLAVVMRLLLGYPISLQLPKDRLGNPDFMDCWSSVMHKLGIDRTSSAEFMQLIGGKDTAKGLTDKGEYNAFLVLVEPTDPLASLVFRIASGTQVLNYVTGVSMGAPGFLPNMYAGIASAALLNLVGRRTLSEFEMNQAQQILHTLRTMHRNVAGYLSKELKAGRANPAEHPSKLLYAAVRLFPATKYLAPKDPSSTEGSSEYQTKALRAVLQEWLATLMQRHYGKSSPESDAAYLTSVSRYFPLQLLGPVEVDPLQQLHPLEFPGTPDTLQPDYEKQALFRLREGVKETEEGKKDEVVPHPVYQQFRRGAERLVELLKPANGVGGGPAAAAGASTAAAGTEVVMTDAASACCIDSVWPEWEQGVLQALLLRWRTARYCSTTTTAEAPTAADADKAAAAAADAAKTTAAASLPDTLAAPAAAAKAEVTWEPTEVGNLLELALNRLREAAAPQLQSYKKARLVAARQKLLAAAVDVLRAHQQDAASASALLQQLYSELGPGLVPSSGERPDGAAKGPMAVLLGQQVFLQRSDVPQIVADCLGRTVYDKAAVTAGDLVKVTPGMLHALVLGSWCTQGPQALRRAPLVLQLCQVLGEDGQQLLKAVGAVEKCVRTSGPNRHGHSSTLQYPGPAGYTVEYAAERKAALQQKLDSDKASRSKKRRKEKKLKLYMDDMLKFSEMVAWAEVAAAGDGAKLVKVAAVAAEFVDAHQVSKLVEKLESALGEKLNIEVAK